MYTNIRYYIFSVVSQTHTIFNDGDQKGAANDELL